MSDIKEKRARCWCERFDTLMKEKGYTQKTFAAEYKMRYGGGTQANVSRWLRVGNKLENGKTIGLPSYETMLNVADLLGVSVGYLMGETDFESFDMEKSCKFMGIDEDTGKAIRGISSGKNIHRFAKYNAAEYVAVLKYLLTAESFPIFIKEMREYADNIYHQCHPIDHMDLASKKINEEIIELAYQCMDYQCMSDEEYGEINDFKDNNVEPTKELLEAIHLLNEARDNNYADIDSNEQKVKLSEYSLQKIYFNLIKEIVAEKHLPDMTIPYYGEEDLIKLKRN